MEWFEIKGYNKKMNHYGNMEEGVNLPKIKEEVLFCTQSYYDDSEDIYFSGYIKEGIYGLSIINNVVNGGQIVVDGIKWARFTKPETNNNIGYAIACCDIDGRNFKNDIPFIIDVGKFVDKIEDKINELIEDGSTKICLFKYIQPCTYKYNWDYVRDNEVSI